MAGETTSKRVASKAARLLRSRKTPKAVKSVAGNNADLVIGHLTENALACQDGVEPVHRYRNGKSWIFSSSGGIGKDLFVKLIGDDYLKANPPIMCGDHPESWMESELYFIYLLKHIQEAGDVQKGLEQAIKGLELAQTEVQGGDRNFYLTDGTDLWIYRKGSSIYYTFKEREQMPMISSDKLGGKWQEIPQDTLTRVQPSEQPTFHALSKE